MSASMTIRFESSCRSSAGETREKIATIGRTMKPSVTKIAVQSAPARAKRFSAAAVSAEP
jgi:hypothetical protein